MQIPANMIFFGVTAFVALFVLLVLAVVMTVRAVLKSNDKISSLYLAEREYQTKMYEMKLEEYGAKRQLASLKERVEKLKNYEQTLMSQVQEADGEGSEAWDYSQTELEVDESEVGMAGRRMRTGRH
jgi:type III secretory pathway component EscR